MKNVLKTFSIVLFLAAMIFTENTFAQDTVKVDPGLNTVADAIANNPGKILLLKRGGVYVQDQIIKVAESTIIVGETGPVADPPAQLVGFELAGTPVIGPFFEVSGDFTVKNVAITGWVIGGIRHVGWFVKMLTPATTFTIDHCVVNHLYVLYYVPGLNNITMNITNNIFWEGWNPPRWHEGYFGYWAGDSLNYNFTNNTVIGYGRALDYLGDGPHGGQKYQHNTFAGCVGNDIFWNRYDSDFLVQNNIFYNVASVGYVGPRSDWGNPYPGDKGDANEDSLRGELGMMDFHPLADSLGIDNSARDIQVNNNLRYTNNHQFAHMTETTAEYIPFLSDTVLARFAKYGWKNENNMLETVDANLTRTGIDPQFVDVDSLSRVTEVQYAWDLCVRDSANVPAFEAKYGSFPAKWPGWLPINPKTNKKYGLSDVIWPIPMNLKPTNPDIQTAGDDGYPLGDLNWYGPEVVAAWEAGLPNPLTAVNDGANNVPDKFVLNQNYPNPFNPTTTITYSISQQSNVVLKVYDVLGKEVTTLVKKAQTPGNYSVEFDASHLTSGVYFYKIEAGGFVDTQKMILMK